MGLRINTNISSLQGQRNLSHSQKALQKAMERLSSGSRINSARDDAAGLAISEGLRSTVRGLSQAIRNANDGIGFLAVADGALAEGTNICQRIRELSIQAANGALADKDRYNLNLEVQQLIQEFNRIATDTDFNGVKLLNGSFQTTELQVGAQKGQSISFSIGDARASRLGALAIKSGTQATITTALAAGDLTINNVAIGASADDKVSTAGESYSALAIANAINAKSGETNVNAEVEKTTVTLEHLGFSQVNNGFVGAFTDGVFKINGFSIAGTAGSADQLATLINSRTNATGVEAVVVDTTTIRLYAKDGRNIQLQLNISDGTNPTAYQDEAVLFAGSVAAAHSFYNMAEFGILTAGNATPSYGADDCITFTLWSIAAGTIWGTDGGVNTGALSIVSSDDVVVSGTNLTTKIGFEAASVAVDYSTALDKMDISSRAGAADALATVDAVIQSIVKIRAGLGAVQNRLESTVSNLSAVNENLVAAESQIRDTDVAAETAEMVRAQVLQQAGVAILGQANVSTQVALNLLRF